MIEQDGVLIHLEPKGDRFEGDKLAFDGWIASATPIKDLRLPAQGPKPLPTCARPDVTRVFPHLLAVGFSGESEAQQIKDNHLRLAIDMNATQIEINYPLAPAFPKPSTWTRIANACSSVWLLVQRCLTTNRAKLWRLTLRRHLNGRDMRAGAFHRRHMDALLSEFASLTPDAVFLQIGANDGLTGDPLHSHINRNGIRWRGVLIEPIPHLFAQLAVRYADKPLLRLEQAVIGEKDGMTRIYRVDTHPDDPLWLQQLASLDRDLLRRNAEQLQRGVGAIVSEEVTSLSVQTLLDKYQLTKLDLLVIDAEGWDWRILRQFNLASLQPTLILYEHQHLSQEERTNAHQFLSRDGYGWAETDEGDTLAWISVQT